MTENSSFLSRAVGAVGRVFREMGRSDKEGTPFLRGFDNSVVLAEGVGAFGQIIANLAERGKIPSTTFGIHPSAFVKEDGPPITITVHGESPRQSPPISRGATFPSQYQGGGNLRSGPSSGYGGSGYGAPYRSDDDKGW